MRVTTDYDEAAVYAENIERVAGIGEQIYDVSLSANGRLTDPSDATDAEEQTDLSEFSTVGEVPDSFEVEGKIPTGSHVVNYGLDMNIDRMLNLRGALGDDDTRLSLDRLRAENGSPHLQILFDRKYIDRTERPVNGETDPWQSGKSSDVILGRRVVPESQNIKDQDTGRLDYQKMIELLADHEDFGSYAALFRQVQGRKNVTTGLNRPSQRGSDLVRGFRGAEPTRAEKKALRDYAEDRDLGHYADGRASEGYATDADLDLRQRRTLVEYVDITWDDDRDDGDYFRELNIQTSSTNPNNTNRQLKYVHDKVVGRAMDRLNPTSPQNGITLQHQRGRANEISQADGKPAANTPTRSTDSLNWENRALDTDEVEAYADNLGKAGASVRDIDQSMKHPVFEVILFKENLSGYLWHVIGIDDGDSLRNATIIKDSRGWW